MDHIFLVPLWEGKYCICSNTSQGFYFLPGSGYPASKQGQPLFGTGVYKISVSITNHVLLVRVVAWASSRYQALFPLPRELGDKANMVLPFCTHTCTLHVHNIFNAYLCFLTNCPLQ